MKQNKYDDPTFFSEYQKMKRSVYGLAGAGEWPIFETMLPPLKDKDVLDLGCGLGWHCKYAEEQQARTVTGIDISEKMIDKAREITNASFIHYVNMPIEEVDFPHDSFDVIISSLAFHYIECFKEICKKVYDWLKPGGSFVFSVEHPIFTSRKEQDWAYDEGGERLHWPVDNYQKEGLRETTFLTENVVKYHRTIESYLNDTILAGFKIIGVKESKATKEMTVSDPEMKNENRRPMFLLVAAEK